MPIDFAPRTLTLEILLEALEADVAGSAQNEDAQEGLDVGAKTRFLTKEQQVTDTKHLNGSPLA